jgi:hypothetical protein
LTLVLSLYESFDQEEVLELNDLIYYGYCSVENTFITAALLYQGHTGKYQPLQHEKYQPPVFAPNTGLGIREAGAAGAAGSKGVALQPAAPAAPASLNPSPVFGANTGG